MDYYPSYLTIKCSNLHIVIHSTVSTNYDVHSLHLSRTLRTHNNGPVLIIPYHQRVPINKVITHSTVSIDYDVHSLLLSRTLKTYNNGPQFIIRYDRHQVFQSTKLSISPCLQAMTCIESYYQGHCIHTIMDHFSSYLTIMCSNLKQSRHTFHPAYKL